MRRITAIIFTLFILVGCGSEVEFTDKVCSLSVVCEGALENNSLSDEKKAGLPSDGVIFTSDSVMIGEGESVFDLTSRMMRSNNIHMEFEKAPAYNSIYIKGIANLYQMDCGDMSGWLFKVNGELSDKAMSDVYPQNGDAIEIFYS